MLLTPDQEELLRVTSHRAVRETTGDVWLVSVKPQPDGEECPLFHYLTAPDGQICIAIPHEWTLPGSEEGNHCWRILNAERAYLIDRKPAS